MARSQLFDSDSFRVLAKVAPIWGFVTRTLSQKRQLSTIVREKLERAGRLNEADGAQRMIDRDFEESLVRALEILHDILA